MKKKSRITDRQLEQATIVSVWTLDNVIASLQQIKFLNKGDGSMEVRILAHSGQKQQRPYQKAISQIHWGSKFLGKTIAVIEIGNIEGFIPYHVTARTAEPSLPAAVTGIVLTPAVEAL